MHSQEIVDKAFYLMLEGLNASQIARRIDVPRSTVRDWVNGYVPRVSGRSGRLAEFELRPEKLPPAYVYLLGLYLGVGHIAINQRGLPRLRVFLDRRYPGIVSECAAAMAEIRPRSRVHRLNRRHSGDVIVSSYSKAWTELFPQHGPGMKHRRDVSLKPWQDELAASRPELLLRGLIQSDGCRFINPGRRWRCPRYTFSNRSDDILAIFKTACDRLGLHWTTAPYTIYVSRKADVARMDEFIGPKA
jgi:Homeodomain-like domain